MIFFKNACLRLTILLTLATVMLNADQENCGQFSIRGDVLYWTPRITGLELNFGTTEINEVVVGCTQILSTEESDLDPHFKWDTGYRVGIGYESECWEAEALYTHFNGKGSKNSHETLDIINSGNVKIELDQIDVALSCNFDLGCDFTLKPILGIRGTRIHQDVNAVLFTEITLFPNTPALETKTFDDEQKYWGVGPLLALQGDWELNCGFGLYGAVGASLLYGHYDIHFNDSDVFTGGVTKELFSNNKKKLNAFDFNIDLAIGLTWHTELCNRYDLDFRLGFEQHQYFNQNRLCVGRGDVSFTGGVFSVELGF